VEWRVSRIDVRVLAVASVFGALSALLEVIRGPPFDIPFPLYERISWDFTGVPMMLSLLLYGPLAGVYACLVGCAIIFLRGNLTGGVFKLLAELATLGGYALLRRGVFPSSILASAARVGVMTVANYYLLPFFYGMPVSVAAGLLPVIAVFNSSQAAINIIPAYLLAATIRRRVPRLVSTPRRVETPTASPG
jgi:riboflavin transporter FmnP